MHVKCVVEYLKNFATAPLSNYEGNGMGEAQSSYTARTQWEGDNLHSGPTPRGLPESEDLVSTACTEPAVSKARRNDFDNHDILEACRKTLAVGILHTREQSMLGKLALGSPANPKKFMVSGVSSHVQFQAGHEFLLCMGITPPFVESTTELGTLSFQLHTSSDLVVVMT
jgi:hypothetical protein